MRSRWADHVGTRNRVNSYDERGSVLIITFIFTILVSIIVLALSSWTANGLLNTTKFTNASNYLYAADGATQLAMRATRYTAPDTAMSTTGEPCPGTKTPINQIDGVYVQDWCTLTATNQGATTRAVTMNACLLAPGQSLSGLCQVTVNGATITVPQLLTAIIDYGDITSPANPANPNCTTTNSSNCGEYMTIQSWVTFTNLKS